MLDCLDSCVCACVCVFVYFAFTYTTQQLFPLAGQEISRRHHHSSRVHSVDFGWQRCHGNLSHASTHPVSNARVHCVHEHRRVDLAELMSVLSLSFFLNFVFTATETTTTTISLCFFFALLRFAHEHNRFVFLSFFFSTDQ